MSRDDLSVDFDSERSINWTDKGDYLFLKGEADNCVIHAIYRQTVSGGQSIVDRQAQQFPFGKFNNCTLPCGITINYIL